MVKIIDSSFEDFLKDSKDKSLFIYGSGERTKVIYHYFALQGKVNAIIDKYKKGKFSGRNEEIPIITLEQFKEKADIEKSIVLIAPTYVYMEIVEELDACEKLNGLRCYIASLIQDYYEKQDFCFTQGLAQIPKKIHYCWFGRGEIPERLKKYMESWHRFCPDYEIVRWDESNYDVTSNQYMKEAYESKKWGYVPDYARLDIIYKEGGIYLDTDVELLAALDKLLNDKMFCHFTARYEISCGIGFGAVKGHELIRKMRDYYDGISFYNQDGTMNTIPCSEYQNPVLQEYGFELNNKYQRIGEAVVYPSEVANPIGRSGAKNNFTQNTVSIHHMAATHRMRGEIKKFAYGIEKIKSRY